MNILAIDPGTKCGWACRWQGNVDSGVQEFPLGRGDSPGMRYIRFRDWLAVILGIAKPDLVVYERPFLRGGAATALLNGLTSRIEEECTRRGIDYEAVNPMTLKKATCGTAKADKAAMIRIADERWAPVFHRHVTDDNEADALNLLQYATEIHDKPNPRKEG